MKKCCETLCGRQLFWNLFKLWPYAKNQGQILKESASFLHLQILRNFAWLALPNPWKLIQFLRFSLIFISYKLWIWTKALRPLFYTDQYRAFWYVWSLITRFISIVSNPLKVEVVVVAVVFFPKKLGQKHYCSIMFMSKKI